jgi:phenylalanyl-tRNA synthetase beta chain
MQQRLKAIGLQPINNVVDITNYVMHSLGQPMHAFDADKISDQKIIVRNAKKDEKFTTLDGIERSLDVEDLMICDNNGPMCIAGILGGLNSGISNSTTNIFLESAYFDPVSIRKSAKRHGISTDASFRFERGIDPEKTKYVLKYAASLISEITGGEISSDPSDEYSKKIKDKQVFLSFENINKLIGQKIPKETVKEILSSLEIKVNNVTESGLGLTIPAYRNDVEREVDVIEELLRVYGYNNISINDKLNSSISNASKNNGHKIENALANQLVSLGFYEIMTNSLTTQKYTALSASLNTNDSITLLNPLSNDLATLRRSMLFSGLETIAYNLNRQQESLKLFEFGKTYHLANEERKENKHLSILMTGQKAPLHWRNQKENIDFFYTKGIVSALIEKMGVSKLKSSPATNAIFEEGQMLKLGKTTLVEYGIIKNSISSTFGIDQVVYFADFNWDAIENSIKTTNVKFKPIPKFPEVKRDFALLIDDDISFEAIYKVAKQTDQKYLKEISLFDVYKGNNLPAGKKSYAISFTLQDSTKTLTDKEIETIMSKLQKQLEKKVGAELR